MTDMTTARAFPGRYFPGQGRSLATFGVTPPSDTLIAIPFDAAGEFDAIAVLAKGGGSADAMMRAGLYDSKANGLPDSLIEDAGEVEIGNSHQGPKDLMLAAPRTMTLPFWVVMLFGGTTVPPMQGSAALPAAEMQRIFGISGANLYAGIYNVATANAVTSAFAYGPLPATFPTPTLAGNTIHVSVRSPL